MNTTPVTTINVGQILKQYIDNNGIFKSALARHLKVADPTINRYQKSSTLQTSIIIKLSLALKHNFFADLAALLPSDFSQPNNPIIEQHEKTIADLEQQITILTAEKKVLIDVLQKK